MYAYVSTQHSVEQPVASSNDYNVMPYNKIDFDCQNEVEKKKYLMWIIYFKTAHVVALILYYSLNFLNTIL